MKTGEKKECEQPEPETDVDLVIDHVDGEDAKTIKSNKSGKKKFTLKIISHHTFEYFLTLRSFQKSILSLLEKLSPLDLLVPVIQECINAFHLLFTSSSRVAK